MSGTRIPPKSPQRIVFSFSFNPVNLSVMSYDASCCSGQQGARLVLRFVYYFMGERLILLYVQVL